MLRKWYGKGMEPVNRSWSTRIGSMSWASNQQLPEAHPFCVGTQFFEHALKGYGESQCSILFGGYGWANDHVHKRQIGRRIRNFAE